MKYNRNDERFFLFKKWLMIFKKEPMMNRAYHRSFEMLDITQAMYEEAKESLQQTKKCFKEADANFAFKLLEKYAWANDACDEIAADVIKERDKSIKPGDAVALALYARWLKRINSHLRNITTSVVNPVDRIGF